MFVCVMFASHPTIVVHILLIRQIRLCLQCITGAVRLAPVRPKSRWLCRFPVYQHAITCEKSLLRQIFCEKSSSTNFLRKINQAFQRTDHEVWKSHVIQTLPWCASILNCHTILSHHLENSPCCAVFLFVILISLMDPNVLHECAQRLVETADFIRNTNWIAK